MASGTVITFDEEKGTGAIRPDNGGGLVHVALASFTKNGIGAPMEGDRVVFDVRHEKSGRLTAVNLRYVEVEPARSP
jgi:CspA family cold shock protein